MVCEFDSFVLVLQNYDDYLTLGLIFPAVRNTSSAKTIEL
uniref:Uncharacterized protein n=1 Tax=Rhizophora mucronata TaxID=61149 RepID=A0A2P2NZY8_RHIMU